MFKNEKLQPILKWVGGKRQVIEYLLPLIPKHFDSYCEPFLGGGALLFTLQPEHAIINDINEELINVYKVIKENITELIDVLILHSIDNNEKYYYEIRDLDRNKEIYNSLTDVQKAARIIYLNKTCYNGLYRVNSNGEFNTPYGKYKQPNIINEAILFLMNDYFNKCNITFLCKDYKDILNNIKKDTFVYMDPPYDPISNTSNFTGYTKNNFDKEEQIRLKNCCDKLNDKNIKFMLSNSSTDFILDLYSKYKIITIEAKRNINSVPTKRGNVNELIIKNY